MLIIPKNDIIKLIFERRIEVIEFILVGVLTGFASGFFGLGGGTVLVPILLLIGVDFKTAVGISVVQMVFSSIYGSILNYLKGTLIFKDGLAIGLGGFTGALASGFIVANTPKLVLGSLFLFFVAFAIVKFFISPAESDKEEINNNIYLFLIGLFIAPLSISVGIGGALLITPIVVGFLNYNLKKAVSLSLFFVVFSSISGFISMSFHGTIDLPNGVVVGLGSLIGVYFGIKYYHRIDSNLHKKLLLVAYFLIFISTALKVFEII